MGLATLDSHASTLPDDVLAQARAADGVILAPVSTYDYPPPEQGGINPSAHIRIALDLYANIRPSRTRTGVANVASLVFGEGEFDRHSLYAACTYRGAGRIWRIPVGVAGAPVRR